MANNTPPSYHSELNDPAYLASLEDEASMMQDYEIDEQDLDFPVNQQPQQPTTDPFAQPTPQPVPQRSNDPMQSFLNGEPSQRLAPPPPKDLNSLLNNLLVRESSQNMPVVAPPTNLANQSNTQPNASLNVNGEMGQALQAQPLSIERSDFLDNANLLQLTDNEPAYYDALIKSVPLSDLPPSNEIVDAIERSMLCYTEDDHNIMVKSQLNSNNTRIQAFGKKIKDENIQVDTPEYYEAMAQMLEFDDLPEHPVALYRFSMAYQQQHSPNQTLANWQPNPALASLNPKFAQSLQNSAITVLPNPPLPNNSTTPTQITPTSNKPSLSSLLNNLHSQQKQTQTMANAAATNTTQTAPTTGASTTAPAATTQSTTTPAQINANTANPTTTSANPAPTQPQTPTFAQPTPIGKTTTTINPTVPSNAQANATTPATPTTAQSNSAQAKQAPNQQNQQTNPSNQQQMPQGNQTTYASPVPPNSGVVRGPSGTPSNIPSGADAFVTGAGMLGGAAFSASATILRGGDKVLQVSGSVITRAASFLAGKASEKLSQPAANLPGMAPTTPNQQNQPQQAPVNQNLQQAPVSQPLNTNGTPWSTPPTTVPNPNIRPTPMPLSPFAKPAPIGSTTTFSPYNQPTAPTPRVIQLNPLTPPVSAQISPSMSFSPVKQSSPLALPSSNPLSPPPTIPPVVNQTFSPYPGNGLLALPAPKPSPAPIPMQNGFGSNDAQYQQQAAGLGRLRGSAFTASMNHADEFIRISKELDDPKNSFSGKDLADRKKAMSTHLDNYLQYSKGYLDDPKVNPKNANAYEEPTNALQKKHSEVEDAVNKMAKKGHLDPNTKDADGKTLEEKMKALGERVKAMVEKIANVVKSVANTLSNTFSNSSSPNP